MMVTPFELVISRMWELGILQFLFPFMFTSAIFYGALRKAQLFGEPEKNVAVNAVVALVAAFMVMAYPVVVGIDIGRHFATFFAQSSIAIMVVLVGLMIVGMVSPPNLGEQLRKVFGGGAFWAMFLIVGLLIGAGIFVSSGIFTLILPEGRIPGISEDILLSIGVLILLCVTVMAIVLPGGGGK